MQKICGCEGVEGQRMRDVQNRWPNMLVKKLLEWIFLKANLCCDWESKQYPPKRAPLSFAKACSKVTTPPSKVGILIALRYLKKYLGWPLWAFVVRRT